MPVPSLVTDLSTTAGSNSPSGSDNVFPDLDNYLRALSAFVASVATASSTNGYVSPYLALSGGSMSGSITLSGGTANQVQYLNGSKVLSGSANLTFDGTTLTAANTNVTGSETLSYGTANGVLYLNGSKVTTSGSALTFDGTNLLVGASSVLNPVSNYRTIQLTGTSGAIFDLGQTATAYGRVSADSTGLNLEGLGNVVTTFRLNNAEQMRLTSTGLGIGTSSPYSGTRLTLQESASSPSGLAIRNRNSTQTWQVSVDAAAVDDKILAFIDPGAGAVRMALDSSGNLGLGVTPSGWSGVNGVFEIKGNSYIYSTTGVMSLGANAYFNGTNWVYKTTQATTRYEQVNGQHQWSYAASGTAGSAITFTQAMTLDASGRLQVATTNATGTNAKLIVGAGLASSDAVIIANTANGNYAGLMISNWTGSATTQGPRIAFDNSGRGSWTVGSSDGANNFDICQTWGTPIARIDSSGNFLGNYTATSEISTNKSGFALTYGAGVGQIYLGHSTSAASGTSYENYYYNGGLIGSITQNGTTAVAFNTTSDRRLKDNIVPAPDAGAKIDAIQIISHDWKSAPDEHVTYGVIAQDLYEVAPQAVTKGDDGAEIEKTWGVDYSKLVPMLIKEVQSLRARVAELERK